MVDLFLSPLGRGTGVCVAGSLVGTGVVVAGFEAFGVGDFAPRAPLELAELCKGIGKGTGVCVLAPPLVCAEGAEAVVGASFFAVAPSCGGGTGVSVLVRLT